jgi:hypothetical protein
LRFVCIQAKPVGRHPELHSINGLEDAARKIMSGRRLAGSIELRIVGIEMNPQTILRNDSLDVGGIKNVKQRPKDRSLWDAPTHNRRW